MAVDRTSQLPIFPGTPYSLPMGSETLETNVAVLLEDRRSTT